MTDVLTPEQRHKCMSNIRSKNTKPEFVVRHLVHSMGYRYRLHRWDLPGCPDMVLPKHHKIIFVHGCFWHMHNCSYGRVTPKTNAKFWQSKREGNVARDKRNLGRLRRVGWKVLTIWECETRNQEKLPKKLERFLTSD
ncbi:Very short patch repair protein [subsurface metagenome]